jgi:hypothetical protein
MVVCVCTVNVMTAVMRESGARNGWPRLAGCGKPDDDECKYAGQEQGRDGTGDTLDTVAPNQSWAVGLTGFLSTGQND